MARIARGSHRAPRDSAIHKDGSTIDVSITLSPLRDPHGRIVEISRIVRDITARKRLDAEALAAELETVRAFFESAAEEIVIVNQAGRIVRTNLLLNARDAMRIADTCESGLLPNATGWDGAVLHHRRHGRGHGPRTAASPTCTRPRGAGRPLPSGSPPRSRPRGPRFRDSFTSPEAAPSESPARWPFGTTVAPTRCGVPESRAASPEASSGPTRRERCSTCPNPSRTSRSSRPSRAPCAEAGPLPQRRGAGAISGAPRTTTPDRRRDRIWRRARALPAVRRSRASAPPPPGIPNGRSSRP